MPLSAIKRKAQLFAIKNLHFPSFCHSTSYYRKIRVEGKRPHLAGKPSSSLRGYLPVPKRMPLLIRGGTGCMDAKAVCRLIGGRCRTKER